MIWELEEIHRIIEGLKGYYPLKGSFCLEAIEILSTIGSILFWPGLLSFQTCAVQKMKVNHAREDWHN